MGNSRRGEAEESESKRANGPVRRTSLWSRRIEALVSMATTTSSPIRPLHEGADSVSAPHSFGTAAARTDEHSRRVETAREGDELDECMQLADGRG